MRRLLFLTLGIAVSACLVLTVTYRANAQTATDLQSQIDQHNAQIAQLTADIEKYQQQLDSLGKQKDTLQSQISSLTISQKQLNAQISVTQNQIASANLRLNQLSDSIGDKQTMIAADQAAIGKALREINQAESLPVIAQLFSTESLGDAWKLADESIQFNAALDANIAALDAAKTELASTRDQVAAKKKDLVSLNAQLATQIRSVNAAKTAQQALLNQTKNQESSYQKLIAQKKASEKSMEAELADLASQLNLIVNPGLLPKVGSGVLTWPFSIAYMQRCAARASVYGNPYCITQYFGNTAFATKNPQIYNGSGHNAVDFGANIGTPVQAALGGTVYGTGNTDLVRGCYSFGKWVMIKHGNGLNTLYAHLSEIDVAAGQSVATGQVLGLSGETGYATGPHLHFGVYASQGTEIMTLKQYRGATTACANATMPVATKDAYLNPLSYL